ncbi:MAG: glycosyltransferase, partial [Chloroflexi bacterium]|nr:glycosyltransferase [Chloroflexota bacterium]
MALMVTDVLIGERNGYAGGGSRCYGSAMSRQLTPSNRRSRARRPTVCLNMIVKNEAHIIQETLASVSPYIDTWVIVDTGSTDDTPELIQSFFRARGIPGELHARPWRDFGHNRSEALDLARGKADYIWVIDADDLVVGTLDLSRLDHDVHLLKYGQDFTYWRQQIFRSGPRWAYRGVVHEYATCLDAQDRALRTQRLEGDYYVQSRRLGDRSQAADKYLRDAALLLREFEEHPDDARTVFYLAQSYYDAGDRELALRYYTLRSQMGGWEEEVFYSLLRRAVILEELNESWPIVQDAYLSAYQHRPQRAEPLYRLALRHRLNGSFALGYHFAKAASDIPRPDADILFINADVYTWRIADERSISAYYVGRYRESFELCTALLANPRLPESQRARIESNRDFAVPRLLEETAAYPAALVERLARQQRRRAAAKRRSRVTLTITSCKRLDLFEQTVNSFLSCCADLELIDRWVCVDDNSSAEDRARMLARYPFFEFIFRTPSEKGHARSMNAILDLVDSPFWLQMEDDWHFFAR